MININLHNAIKSYELALLPSDNMIDGRSNKEQLRFLVDFASLINFYDKSNKVSGNWQPFLLKDPVILIASIAKTPFKNMYSLFTNTCLDLFKTINVKSIEISVKQQDLSLSLNHLFYSLTGVYQQMEYWTTFMKQASLDYNLKSYVFNKIKETYGAIFWAILSFQEYLMIQKVIKGIRPVNWEKFSSYDQEIWKESKNKTPFWEVLGLFSSNEDNNYLSFQDFVNEHINNDEYDSFFLNDIYTSLKNIGDQTYTFLNSIVDYAFIEYEEVSLKKDNYPDTVLVRTFVHLMDIYKNQMNLLSKKHLDFYYKDILKQKKELAQPDAVYACANLSFNDGIYKLLEGTEFSAGENEKQETILFASEKETSFNPAQITQAYTLYKTTNNNKRDSLNLAVITNLDEIQKDENGKVQSWKTFGTQTPSENVNISCVFASPMLFLNQANKRTIQIKLTFQENISEDFFKSINYYLSTEEEWFPIKPDLEIALILEIKAVLNLVFQDIEKLIRLLLKEAEHFIKEVYNLFEELITFLLDLSKNILNKLEIILSETDKELFNEIKNSLEEICKDLEEKNLFKILKDIIQLEENLIQTLSKRLEEILTIIFNALKDLSIEVFKSLLKLGEDILNELKGFGNTIYKELQIIINQIEKGKLLEDVEKVVKEIFENLPVFLKNEREFIQIIKTYLTAKHNVEQDFPNELKFKSIVLKTVLNAEDPAIVAFTENPDGLESLWPMFKMDFLEFVDISSPPKIEKLEISVMVEELSNIVLYNDFGALSTENPFQPFGPIPERNQNFIIGSNEVFSKPVYELNVTLNWDNLPENGFCNYYKEYNESINKKTVDCIPTEIVDNGFFDVIVDLLKLIVNFFKNKVDEKKIQEDITIKKGLTEEEEFVKNHVSRIAIQADGTNGNTFCNTCFPIKFQQLYENNWGSFNTTFQQHQLYKVKLEEKIKHDSEDGKIVEEKTEKLYNYSTYTCKSSAKQINAVSNPNLQKELLEFTESINSGFMRIQLLSKYGFGSILYPKLISQIALENAQILVKDIKNGSDGTDNTDDTNLKPQPNVPYVPVASSINVSYKTFCAYDFKADNLDYPLECFYYTPFSKYKVYDTTSGLEITGTTIGSLTDNLVQDNLLPLYPSFIPTSQLFLSLEDLISPNELSLYFSLTRNSSNAEASKSPVLYSYLNKNGWNALEVLSDGTSNMSCSGVTTLSVPEKISNEYVTFSPENEWISLSIEDNPDFYSETSFLKTNGFKLIRTGNTYLEDVKTPHIDSEIITSPKNAIPQIESIIQPFPSFGGKAKETSFCMDRRTSTRLKTKDRVITTEDYYRIIQLNFLRIYFSKIVYNPSTNNTEVLLVKRVGSWKETNAFLPLVSNCKEIDVSSFLEARVSGSVNLKVSNFEISYVKIIAEIIVASGYSLGEVSKLINQQLHVFISPWIQSDQDQIQIDTGINTSQIANFLKNNKAIDSIKKIELKIGSKNSTTGIIEYACIGVQEITELVEKHQLDNLKKWCVIINQISEIITNLVINKKEALRTEAFNNKIIAIVSNVFMANHKEFNNTIIVSIGNKLSEVIDKTANTLDNNSIKKLVEKIIKQFGFCNTAYITKKTLLVPSLDDSSIKFTNS